MHRNDTKKFSMRMWWMFAIVLCLEAKDITAKGRIFHCKVDFETGLSLDMRQNKAPLGENKTPFGENKTPFGENKTLTDSQQKD